MTDHLKQPPHSLEAEQAVLGAVIGWEGAYSRIQGRLVADDFYRHAHRLIFSAVLSLDAEGKPLDPVTLAEQMENENTLSNGGGLAYLVHVAENCPSAANVEAYADIVRKRSIKRALLAVCADVQERSNTADPEELMADLQAGIDRISKQGGSKYYDFTDVLLATDEVINAAKQSASKSESVGVPIGLPALDRRIGGLPDGRLIILAARPSVGKSALAQQIAINASRKTMPVGICSLEMSAEEIGIRSYAHVLGINGTGLTFGDQDIVDRWEQAEKSPMLRYPLFVDVDTYSLAGIVARGHEWKQKHDIRLFIVDYLQLIEDCKGETKTLQVADATRTLKKLAKRLNIPVLLLSQLNRKVEEQRRWPQLSDLRDSGSIEQDCDVALFLHSDDEENEGMIDVEIGVLKTRYGRRGWLKQNFRFDGQTQRFMEHHVDRKNAA